MFSILLIGNQASLGVIWYTQRRALKHRQFTSMYFSFTLLKNLKFLSEIFEIQVVKSIASLVLYSKIHCSFDHLFTTP